MSGTVLLDPSRLKLDVFRTDRSSITAVMASRSTNASCPLCGIPSSRVHSRYVRILADLPWHDVAVFVHLTVQRFFCETAGCARRIFAERLPGIVAPYARRTARLSEALEFIGFVLGGEAGARVLRRLAMCGSPDTLLRAVRRATLPEPAIPRILGVDDFAFRRGRRYGTLLVDLERRCRVDLLPDRTAETLASWLRERPGVEIIARDRAGAYADGIAQGAPQAVQVADRFHLAKNLGDTLYDLFNRQRRHLPMVTRRSPLGAVREGDGQETTGGASPLATSQAQKQGQCKRRDQRLERYQHLMALRERGASVQEAAHRVGIGKRTANRWIAAGRFPERKIRQRTASTIDTYTDYIQRRWDEGCRNRTQIWREICEQGYEGSYPSVYQYLVRVQAGAVTPAGATLAPGAARRRLSPRQAVWLLLRPEDTLDADDCTLLAELQHVCKDAAAAHPLAQDFLALLRERKHDEFDHWVTAAQESGLPELERFALGLRRDAAAVRAALSVEHSNGQTEGQVNRLKVIKRAMYGRGNFDLLRQRVLHAG